VLRWLAPWARPAPRCATRSSRSSTSRSPTREPSNHSPVSILKRRVRSGGSSGATALVLVGPFGLRQVPRSSGCLNPFWWSRPPGRVQFRRSRHPLPRPPRTADHHLVGSVSGIIRGGDAMSIGTIILIILIIALLGGFSGNPAEDRFTGQATTAAGD